MHTGGLDSDLARVMSVIQRFGINTKVAIVTALGKESFAGVYPDALNGALITGTRPSDGIPGNADDAKYMADRFPTAMLFIPCRGGKSHTEVEWAEPEALARGANVMLEVSKDLKTISTNTHTGDQPG